MHRWFIKIIELIFLLLRFFKFKGFCVCANNYTGDDCSIDTKVPPQLISTLFSENSCDISLNDCQQVSLYATGLSSDTKIVYVCKFIFKNFIKSILKFNFRN
jgi:hypothetical protein